MMSCHDLKGSKMIFGHGCAVHPVHSHIWVDRIVAGHIHSLAAHPVMMPLSRLLFLRDVLQDMHSVARAVAQILVDMITCSNNTTWPGCLTIPDCITLASLQHQ